MVVEEKSFQRFPAHHALRAVGSGVYSKHSTDAVTMCTEGMDKDVKLGIDVCNTLIDFSSVSFVLSRPFPFSPLA